MQYLLKTKKRGLSYTNERNLTIPTKEYRLTDTNKKSIIFDYPKQGKFTIPTITDASDDISFSHVTYIDNVENTWQIIAWPNPKIEGINNQNVQLHI